MVQHLPEAPGVTGLPAGRSCYSVESMLSHRQLSFPGRHSSVDMNAFDGLAGWMGKYTPKPVSLFDILMSCRSQHCFLAVIAWEIPLVLCLLLPGSPEL